jgi:ribosome-binding protein aMBF1 (putative translation factor)
MASQHERHIVETQEDKGPMAGLVTKRHTVCMGRPKRTTADRQLMRDVGMRLRWVREARGLTQAEIADQVGVSDSAWSLYERGLRFPDIFEATRLLAKLRISREYLLEGRLSGVEAGLAIRLAAAHPHLADTICMDEHTDIAV